MKIKEFKCRNCQYDDFQFMANPRNRNMIGIYCSRCGKWFKWADKDEKNLMRLAESEKDFPQAKDIEPTVKGFADTMDILDRIIGKESEVKPNELNRIL